MKLFECNQFFHRRCIANKRNPARGRQESEQWGWKKKLCEECYWGRRIFILIKNNQLGQFLENKLRDSGHYEASEPLTIEHTIQLLSDKFSQVDFRKVRE
jgi:hypothetical protein